MNCIKNKTTIIIKYFTLRFNLFLNLCRCSKGKSSLGINTSSPENKLVTIFFFKFPRIHS